MRREPVVGLLPLFLKLYDERLPGLRAPLEKWAAEIAAGLRAEGARVAMAKTCRVKGEAAEALRRFKGEDVDIIVTLHLAYAPSLEFAGVLAAARRPILLLDTTPDVSFGLDVHPDRILYNHGIHGVQDLACMLRRMGVAYEIAAGHARASDVLRRAADIARAAFAARTLRRARVLRIGPAFEGMGDFAVTKEVLRGKLGITVEAIAPSALARPVRAVSAARIEAELAADRARYAVAAPPDVHRRSVRVGLGLRALLDAKAYDAVSLNFAAFDSRQGPVDTVPFLEVSKATARGIGYAGEGDVLTAALVGALSRAFGRTTFTETFCPDWKGNAIFLAHMGEINPEVAARKPRLVERDFPWTGARNPAILACAPAPGPAVLVNLAPGPDDTFALLVAPVDVLGDAKNAELRQGVRGWVRPRRPLPGFLEEYSRRGGTHHSALVLGDRAEAMMAFARFAGIEAERL